MSLTEIIIVLGIFSLIVAGIFIRQGSRMDEAAFRNNLSLMEVSANEYRGLNCRGIDWLPRNLADAIPVTTVIGEDVGFEGDDNWTVWFRPPAMLPVLVFNDGSDGSSEESLLLRRYGGILEAGTVFKVVEVDSLASCFEERFWLEN